MFNILRLKIKNIKERNKINRSLKILCKQQKEISTLQIILNQRLNKLNLLYKKSLSNNDSSYDIYKNEYSDIEKLLSNIRINEILIIKSINRMETLKDIHIITNSLEMDIQEYKSIDASLSNIMPDLNNQILMINKSLNQSSTLPELSKNEIFEVNPSIQTNILQPIINQLKNKSDKIESIVKNNQITSIGNKEFNNTSETPMNFKKYNIQSNDKINLDNSITDYINENNGKFDVVDAANELGLSIETVETKTIELMNKGRINIKR